MAALVYSTATQELVDVAASKVLGKILVCYVDSETNAGSGDYQVSRGKSFQDRARVGVLSSIVMLRLLEGGMLVTV